MATYAVTGATGKLGTLVLDELLLKVEPADVVALARDTGKLSTYADKGVQLRQADYDDPASLDAALQGVDRLLLISGNAVGERERQHGNVIRAAEKAGVSYFAYTSILKGDASPLQLAPEHVATERLLAASKLNYDILRNGWYSENYTGGLGQALETGAILGAAGEGRISSAARADFAAGAAAALVSGKGGDVYELAGDESWTMAEFAAEVSRLAGKPVEYRNLSEGEFAKVLEGAGLPPPVAAMLASTSALTAKGALHDESGDLSRLAGRPTTPIAETIARALR
ncbi:NAD(P)-dependent oxidoreductase [Altererythrobacter sp. B11]|uniref:SDR family oxidoreductase n=1 Tax=Altererythrobacter sp. B11 TaxID=2060312 RepID=UPI000DC6E952|nr:SDR family oxidoreductase [Altererythrobacter sp. B11]BBC71844.1 NAD(P)-dependent oxidoreductase [Altererythrobacter sp. B11]